MPDQSQSGSSLASNATGPQGVPLELLPHDSKQPDIIACCLLTWLIAAAFVWMRFYTRVSITRVRLGLSEWAILIALVFSLVTSVCMIMQVQYGLGAHVYDLTPATSNMALNVLWQWISILFYSLSMSLTRISILLLYVGIFYHSWVRPASYTVMAIVAIVQIWVFYVLFSACIPLKAFWDITVKGRCHPQAYFLSNQYLAIACDFLVFLLPIPVLGRLKIRLRQKILLLWLFALGFFVCLISIIRIVVLQPILDNAGADPTYNTVPVFFWTVVEINAAIVVACGTTLKPLINRFMPQLLSSHPYRESSDPSGEASGPRANVTFGSTPSDRTRVGRNVRVDSSFTAEFKGKTDEEMAHLDTLDMQGRKLRDADPYHMAMKHELSSPGSSASDATLKGLRNL